MPAPPCYVAAGQLFYERSLLVFAAVDDSHVNRLADILSDHRDVGMNIPVGRPHSFIHEVDIHAVFGSQNSRNLTTLKYINHRPEILTFHG